MRACRRGGSLSEPPRALSLSTGGSPAVQSEPSGAVSEPSRSLSPSPELVEGSGEPQPTGESSEAAAPHHLQSLPVARLHASPTADGAVSAGRIESDSPPPARDPLTSETTIERHSAPEEPAPVAPLTSQTSLLDTPTPLPSVGDVGSGETSEVNTPAPGVASTEFHAPSEAVRSGRAASSLHPAIDRTSRAADHPHLRRGAGPAGMASGLARDSDAGAHGGREA